MNFFLILVTIFFLFPGSIAARDLLIMGVDKEPMRFINDEGQYTGIDVEIIDHIFNKMNIKYKIKLLSSSPRLKLFWQAQQPKVDMVLTYSYKPSRAEYLIYAKESHLSIRWHFFILKKNEDKIHYNTLKDLKGLSIGATTDYAYTSEFWNAANQGLFKLDKNPCNELQIKKLLAERFDTVPLQIIATLYQAKQNNYQNKISHLPKPLKEKAYYNTFVKNSDYPGLNQLIEKYDVTLKQMKVDGTLKAIYEKYGLLQN